MTLGPVWSGIRKIYHNICNVTLAGYTLSLKVIGSGRVKVGGVGVIAWRSNLGKVHLYYIDVTLIDKGRKMYCSL